MMNKKPLTEQERKELQDLRERIKAAQDLLKDASDWKTKAADTALCSFFTELKWAEKRKNFDFIRCILDDNHPLKAILPPL